MTDIHSVNHVGMAVRDLAACATRFEAIGFTLTPFSAHSGAWRPGEAVARLGAGNRCVMFGRSYLEILASEDPSRPSERIENFLARHQGGHIICFGSDDVTAVDRRLVAAGVATSGVIPLQRDVDTPEGVRTARFERVQFAPAASPEGYIQAARHLTPDYIHQPRYTRHPNGASELVEVLLAVPDRVTFVERYNRYCGVAPIERGACAVFTLPWGSRVAIVAAEQLARELPGSLAAPPPAIVAVTFRVARLETVGQRLTRAAIRHARTSDRIVVPAEEAFGLALVFQEDR